MELKNYQKNVIKDLVRYLELLSTEKEISKAYKKLWNDKGVNVGFGGMQNYKCKLPGVPEVCFKVPTGGGKTFLAANSVKPIFDAIPSLRSNAVVWLVPSDAILTQTYNALSNPQHPYRQKLDVDFGSRVEVYSKNQLLSGQNFNPTTVTEQLSVFVLSYDSFRTSKKDGRKAYQENGNLEPFARQIEDRSVLLEDTDDTALIQVIRTLNPLVIVDESHHATSQLSKEMLENFNPCFVLDLTATPHKDSNIISFVDAAQLKKENMVKLPVIVYNRKSQNDVFVDALTIRQKLEMQAKVLEEKGGNYIRPIVLFQAQPKNNKDSTTYEKIKQTLVDCGVPENEIAIKTADKDELKNVDLMSRDCKIRYIITVNALKEGWDCPFAYILATVANRTSSVDVEQILGRVLRLPYTKRNESNVLNLSYVLTSSSDFGNTLENVVKGLNNAGFSDKDCRAEDPEETVVDIPEQTVIEPHTEPDEKTPEEDVPKVDTTFIRNKFRSAVESDGDVPNIKDDELLSSAEEQGNAYDEALNNYEETDYTDAPTEVRDKMNVFRMNEKYKDEASELRLPQFMLKIGASLFSDAQYVPLTKEHLSEGFTLKDKDCSIDFNSMETEMARVDVQDDESMKPKIMKLDSDNTAYFKEWFNAQPDERRLSICKGMIKKQLSKLNEVNDNELSEYIDRVIATLDEDRLSDLEQSPYPYISKIKEKVNALLDEHRSKKFDLWVEQGKISCQPNYQLLSSISPTTATDSYAHSLYTSEEGNMNEYEKKMVLELSSNSNIKWWHRNISRKGFKINGPIYAYPDIIAMTNSGKVLMVETKGDQLENSESKNKALIGHKWDMLSGTEWKYYMVFEHKNPDYEGACSFERFIEIIKDI